MAQENNWVWARSGTCVALYIAGSAGYGFWYRLLNNPEGPSTTTTSCPKFTPLAQFKDNVAHSNMFYGFRIHPEYYPIQRPCDMMSNFQQVPAVFDGLISYKNGVKGAIATQVRTWSTWWQELFKDLCWLLCLIRTGTCTLNSFKPSTWLSVTNLLFSGVSSQAKLQHCLVKCFKQVVACLAVCHAGRACAV